LSLLRGGASSRLIVLLVVALPAETPIVRGFDPRNEDPPELARGAILTSTEPDARERLRQSLHGGGAVGFGVFSRKRRRDVFLPRAGKSLLGGVRLVRGRELALVEPRAAI
jgi:hypothetical protein